LKYFIELSASYIKALIGWALAGMFGFWKSLALLIANFVFLET